MMCVCVDQLLVPPSKTGGWNDSLTEVHRGCVGWTRSWPGWDQEHIHSVSLWSVCVRPVNFVWGEEGCVEIKRRKKGRTERRGMEQEWPWTAVQRWRWMISNALTSLLEHRHHPVLTISDGRQTNLRQYHPSLFLNASFIYIQWSQKPVEQFSVQPAFILYLSFIPMSI